MLQRSIWSRPQPDQTIMMLSLTAPQGGDLRASASDDVRPAATGFWALTLGSIGVVYGDIGTSPLYAFREAIVAATAGGAVTNAAVLGVICTRSSSSVRGVSAVTIVRMMF